MKPIIKTTLAACLLIVVSCTKENNDIKSSAFLSSANSTLKFTIGQHYGGGVIFYIDGTKQHGLIADTADLPLSKWTPPKDYPETNATSESIGKGYENTMRIVAVQGDSSHYAAQRCWDSKRNGYTDWFLPSTGELFQLYRQKDKVPNLFERYYWSSTEFELSSAWFQDMVNGSREAGGQNRHTKHSVRAIRSF